MEGHQQDRHPADNAQAPHPAPSPGTAPEEVRHLAAAHGLGDLVDVRHEISRKSALSTGGAMIIGSSGLLTVLFSVVGAPDPISSSFAGYAIFNIVRIALLYFWFRGLGTILRGIFVGSRSCYLYSGGLVHSRRGGPFAISWPEVASFAGAYNKRGTSQQGRIIAYQATTRDGRSFRIPLVLINGSDRLIDLIIGNLRAHGCPIK